MIILQSFVGYIPDPKIYKEVTTTDNLRCTLNFKAIKGINTLIDYK